MTKSCVLAPMWVIENITAYWPCPGVCKSTFSIMSIEQKLNLKCIYITKEDINCTSTDVDFGHISNNKNRQVFNIGVSNQDIIRTKTERIFNCCQNSHNQLEQILAVMVHKIKTKILMAFSSCTSTNNNNCSFSSPKVLMCLSDTNLLQ